MKRVLLAAIFVAASSACHSEELPLATTDAATTSPFASTTIVERELTDAMVPDCTIHFVTDAFNPTHGAPAGSIRVEGDYTRTLAKVTVSPMGHPAWSGSFSGPRESFIDVMRLHLCSSASVYALKANGNKDPSKGLVALDAFVMTADEKGDVENLCNAYARAPNTTDAGNVQLRDRAAMEWAEDTLTTTRWDAWRRSFARELRDAYGENVDAKDIFTKRARDLETAAAALGLKCDTAAQWKKR